jgi:type II secretory pathway component PulF
MNYFNVAYIVRGKKNIELVEAENKFAAKSIVARKYKTAVISKIELTSPPLGVVLKDMFSFTSKIFKGKINAIDKISTIRQIAVMTDAGIPINDTFADVSANSHNKRLSSIYGDISTSIDAGKSLSEAMEPYREDFGHVTLAMAKLGERTGSISNSFAKLAGILENVRNNISRFKKAIRAPMITLGAMGIAFTILIMVVVPKFKEIFAQFKTELPLPTRILLTLENAFSHYGIFILMAIVAIVIALKYYYKNNSDFKMSIDKMLINKNFYLINKVIFLSTMHKYTLVLGELIKSGIPVSEALDTAVGMVENSYMKQKLEMVNVNIGRGVGISDSFAQTELFENMLLQMIRAGEASGQLDAMLDKVTEYYDMKFQDIIDNLSSYIEPIMMFFIAILVLLMALGIFMPMWDLGKAAKG